MDHAYIPRSRSLDNYSEAVDGHQCSYAYRRRQRRDRSPGLYSIHGGGMILGDVGMNDARCAATALELDVDGGVRRVPPGARAPVSDGLLLGLLWFFDQAEAMGLDAPASPSAVAARPRCLALLARDRRQVSPCFQLLTFPMVDDRNETPSTWSARNRAANITGWSAYLDGRGADDVPAYAAPARATDLGGLAPAIITVGSLDIFLDEDIAYAQALLEANVPCELHVYPGAFHGSNFMVPHSDISQRWYRDEIAALDRALNGS